MSQIVPSILAANFANLRKDIQAVEKAGAKLLHLDVMDGNFVPQISLGEPVIRAVRETTELMLDVHLMITNADARFESYIDAGADCLSVHIEAVTHLDRVVSAISERGVKAGVVLNPHTPLQSVEEILPKCHHVLLMSVNPGYGGQSFISGSLDKVRRLKKMILSRGLETLIEIDGGVGPANTEEVVRAGVDWVVAGSAVFGTADPAASFRQMQEIADHARV